MSAHFQRAWGGFDRERFISLAAAKLEDLELKERSNQIKGIWHNTL